MSNEPTIHAPFGSTRYRATTVRWHGARERRPSSIHTGDNPTAADLAEFARVRLTLAALQADRHVELVCEVEREDGSRLVAYRWRSDDSEAAYRRTLDTSLTFGVFDPNHDEHLFNAWLRKS